MFTSSNLSIDKFILDIENQKKEKLSRIYIGSYFCSQYFLLSSGITQIVEFCEKNRIEMTLVIPVFSEKDLSTAKHKIAYFLNNYKLMTEVTVNDYGMLNHIQKNFDKKINLGRLFFKDPRDIRIKDYFIKKLSPSYFTFTESGININLVELDNTQFEPFDCKDFSFEFKIGVHTPWCFMSTGNICKHASIHRSIEKKFRPNCVCRLECEATYEEYNKKDFCIIHFGRTIYYYNALDNEQNYRLIYFPLVELKNYFAENEHENFGTT